MNFIDPLLIFVVVLNLILMIFAHKILSIIYHEPIDSPGFRQRVIIFRIFNVVIIVSFILSKLFENQDTTHLGYTIVAILTVLYLSYASLHLLHYWVRVKYGKQKEVEGSQQVIDTYNSRLLNIFSTVIISVIALISIVRLLGFDTLLEAGGAIGIIGVFLALTQSAWAPDIISGLVILNSKMMDVGDVIEFNDGEKTLGVVYKTRIFYSEILNLTNNHRIMIKNSKLRDLTIHNLSKFASAKGLRECLKFNIDYHNNENQVKEMFLTAYQRMNDNQDVSLDSLYPIEIAINETGHYAVEWACYYYTKDIKNIITIRQQFREEILKTSKEMNISLATPQLHTVDTSSLSKTSA